MTDKEEGDIEINEAAVEPKDYFKILKGKLNVATHEKLEKQLEMIASHILMAKKVGQKNLLERLSFTWGSILKEQTLLASGVESFVYKDDIKKFLDTVEPKNSIKIIELERYPRAIPFKNLEAIEAVQKLGIFDELCVVFTDFTGEDHASKKDREFVKRNRDPVVFGYFYHKRTGIKHDRFYFITDWEDEHCDLTFGKMVEKMAAQGIKNPAHKIATDDVYLREVIHDTLEEMSAEKKGPQYFVEIKNETFWGRVKKWLDPK